MKEISYSIETVAFHITRKCSNRCIFCYAEASNVGTHAEHGTLEKIIEAFAENNVKSILFVGGDPCAYPRLIDLCGKAKQLGLSTIVLSNTHAYKENMDDVVSVIDYFEATISGATGQEHDSITTLKGSYDFLIKNLKKISEKGKPIGITYNILPQSSNKLFVTVQNIIENYKIKVESITLQRIIPTGRGKGFKNFAISQENVLEILQDVERLQKEYAVKASFEDPVPFCIVPEKYHKYIQRCEWGLTRASVDGEGNFSRCSADPESKIGNILITPINELWNHSPILRSYRKRTYLSNVCKECRLLEQCGGGCSLSCNPEAGESPDYLILPEVLRKI